MLKFISALILLISFFFIKAESVSADNFVVSTSASLKRYSNNKSDLFDHRLIKLTLYLNKHNSPLEPYSHKIILEADKHNLDWRLLAAIAGVESSFAKRMPYNSYNAFGWANGTYKFSSWEEAIETVSFTLRKKYIDKGADNIEKIAGIYAPPSKTWASKVKYFINQIDSSPIVFNN